MADETLRKKSIPSNERDIVLSLLVTAEKTGAYSSRLLQETLAQYDTLSAQQKGFIRRLAEGTTERRIELDYCLNQVSKTPVDAMKPLIRSLLRMSAYQIMFMENVPDGAACNEAVRLSAQHHFSSLRGFVNGVLRNLSRTWKDIPYPNEDDDLPLAYSVRFSMPLWLVKHFLQNYGQARTKCMLEAFLEPQRVCVRMRGDMTKEETDALLSAWSAQGIAAHPHPYLPYAYHLLRVGGVHRLAGYAEGQFAVQDVSSMLAVEAAGICPGQQVLDLCAAPGGKTVFAAEKAGLQGSVRSFDISEAKAEKIRENVSRLCLNNVRIAVSDARIFRPDLAESADVVLADVPCSGLGVIGKKPEIKYRLQPSDVETLPDLQREILRNAAAYVRPGGVLLYSTCTLNPAENEEMADWFCENFPFERADFSDEMPEVLRGDVRKGTLQLLPGVHETDGFFMAKFQKQ